MVHYKKKQEVIARRERRQRVEELFRKGVSKTEIAARLGTSRVTITSDIKWIEENWAREDPKKVKQKRRRRIARLEQLIREHWLAWEKSKEESEKSLSTDKPKTCPDCSGTAMDEDGDWCSTCDGEGKVLVSRRSKKVKKTAGDVKFLAEIRKCETEIAKLQGLYPEQRVKVKAEGQVRIGGRVLHQHELPQDMQEFAQLMEQATDEQLLELRESLDGFRETVTRDNREAAKTIDVEFEPSEE